MNISKPFIIRPIATSLLMLAILLSGLLSFGFLPISSLPEVEYPIIQVKTTYPGASPKVVASSVTGPLERQLGQMASLKQMSSTSSNGLSLITLKFNLDLSLDVAGQSVQAALDAASNFLPDSLPSPPIYNKVNPADPPIMTLSVTSKNTLLSKVEDYSETRIAEKISQISGVGLVSISGGNRPAVRIQLNQEAITSYGLSTTDIRNSINAANINAAKGNFDGERLSYTIDSNDQLIMAKEYADMIVAYVNNSVVRLKDVANVIDDVENLKQAAWDKKDPAIILNVQKQPGANVIKVADSIKILLPIIAETLPKDIEIKILNDQTKTIRASIADTKFELCLSIILVIIVIFCFLRNVSATIIPSIAIPLSLVGTIGVIYLLGFSINNLTLMALTIATGFVVDDAIVMIENIERYLEKGMKPLEAALKGSEQIAFTIISLTISLIAVLIPLFFMADIIGRLFREFAITLAITILISAFISLTLTPMLCATILKHKEIKNNKFVDFLENLLTSMISFYEKTLKIVLNHQSITMAVAISTLLLTGILFLTIPKGFFPEEDTGMIEGISEIRQDASFANIITAHEQITDIILTEEDIVSISSYVGIDGVNITQNSGRFLIILKDKDERKASIRKIMDNIQRKLSVLSGVRLFLQPQQDLSIDDQVTPSKYQYSITSHDREEVVKYSEILLNKLSKLDKIKNVTNDQKNNGLQMFIEINRDKASIYGVSVEDIANTLYDLYGQRQISTIFSARNQYYVILEASPDFVSNVDSLKNIYIKSSSNSMVPLINVVNITKKNDSLVITRINQMPSSSFSFDIKQGSSLGEAIEIVEREIEKLKLPDHIDKGFGGTALSFKSSVSNQGWLIVGAIIVVYLVLGILYENYIHPVTILSTLPSACIGALISLILVHKDLNIVAIIGVILLIGIVKKNAIMMIDFALDLQRNFNKNAEEAIFEACLLRFRPILMTSMAALLGAVPLAFGSGMGSEIRSPLGITIIGGLLVSQVLTLYTTPVIYLAFDRFINRKK